MTIGVLGIDLGKNMCSLVGLDANSAVVARRRMRRGSSSSFVLSLPRCAVAMERCCGAHHLGRIFSAAGFEVRLMSPEYVRPYVKARDGTMPGMPRRSLRLRGVRQCVLCP